MILRKNILHAILLVLFFNSLHAELKVEEILTSKDGLNNPFGVDFDSKGNMYLVELEGGRVYKMPPGGKCSVIGGNGKKGFAGDGGPVKSAVFNGMHNVVVGSDDSVYISDSWNFCVRKIDPESGNISTVIGTGKKGYSGDNGPALKASFTFIMNIIFDPSKERIYMSDIQNRRIRMFDLKTGKVKTVAGNGNKGVAKEGASAISTPLQDPRAVAVDSKGNIYVLERQGHMLLMVDTNGKIHRVAGTGKKGFKDGKALEAQLNGPKYLCVDKDDNVYIADDFNHAIRKYDPVKKTVTTILGRGFGDSKITLKRPHGVTFHKDGTLYVSDSWNHRVLKVVFD